MKVWVVYSPGDVPVFIPCVSEEVALQVKNQVEIDEPNLNYTVVEWWVTNSLEEYLEDE